MFKNLQAWLVMYAYTEMEIWEPYGNILLQL